MSSLADKQLLHVLSTSPAGGVVRLPALLQALTMRKHMRIPGLVSSGRASPLATMTRSGRRSKSTIVPSSSLGEEDELRALLEFQLDALQTRIGGLWRRVLRLAACVLSALVALLLVVGGEASNVVALAVVPLAFGVGGAFSWFIRDIVALVEGRRR